VPDSPGEGDKFAADLYELYACASLESIATHSKVAVSSLIKNANTLAEGMIKTYWDTQEAMQDTMTIAVVSVVAAGLSAGAASGAVVVTGSLGGGCASLASAMYSFHLSDKELSVKTRQGLLDGTHQMLVEVESAMTEADDEIYQGIDSLRSEWNMREIAIPAPPGSDEVDIESFHHGSSL
jgi:hypothetical protein